MSSKVRWWFQIKGFFCIPGRDLASVCLVIEQVHFPMEELEFSPAAPDLAVKLSHWGGSNQIICTLCSINYILSNVKVNRVVATSV